jgi:hypothetical protein
MLHIGLVRSQVGVLCLVVADAPDHRDRLRWVWDGIGPTERPFDDCCADQHIVGADVHINEQPQYNFTARVGGRVLLAAGQHQL